MDDLFWREPLAPRHYRIAPPGDMPRKTTSAASGRRPVVTGRCASDRPPDEHRHGACHRLVDADHLRAGPAGVRRALHAAPVLHDKPAHQRRAAGTVRPHRHDAAVGRRLVGIDGRAKPPAAASGTRASSPTRSSNVSGPNTAPDRCRSPGPLPAQRATQPHPLVGQPAAEPSRRLRSESSAVRPRRARAPRQPPCRRSPYGSSTRPSARRRGSRQCRVLSGAGP